MCLLGKKNFSASSTPSTKYFRHRLKFPKPFSFHVPNVLLLSFSVTAGQKLSFHQFKACGWFHTRSNFQAIASSSPSQTSLILLEILLLFKLVDIWEREEIYLLEDGGVKLVLEIYKVRG